MKNVKMPTSDSWQEALIESLRDPKEATGYIEAILEEKTLNPNCCVQRLKMLWRLGADE
jgi:hypothetical protein